MNIIKSVFLLLALSFAVNTGYAESGSSKKQESKVIGLDVRTVGEVKSEPAPGSINIPLSDVTSKIAEVVKDKNQEIHVFCAVGGRSRQAKLQLEKMGYTNVKNIKTWKEWNKEQK